MLDAVENVEREKTDKSVLTNNDVNVNSNNKMIL